MTVIVIVACSVGTIGFDCVNRTGKCIVAAIVKNTFKIGTHFETTTAFQALSGFINKIASKHKSEPSKRSADDMYILMYGAVLALAPTVIVAVQSIGQIQAGTYVLITLFVLLALLYVRHQKRVK